MSFLLIAGSPTQPSRSATLLKQASLQLARAQHHVMRLDIRALDSQALVLADCSHPSTTRATQQLVQAWHHAIACNSGPWAHMSMSGPQT